MQQETPPPKRRRRIRIWLLLALAMTGYVGFVAARLFLFAPRLEIGPETTFVEGPLRPDGTIDYAAALNEEWSKGVTPENNAAVPLARAFGPAAVAPEIREEYFRQLGIEMPPESGTYLVTLKDYLKERGFDEKQAEEVRDAAGDRTLAEAIRLHAEIAWWLERNEQPMEQVLAASRLDRMYVPVILEDPSKWLFEAPVLFSTQLRDAALLFRLRAQKRLADGDPEGACEEAFACHRLGRLVAQRPIVLSYLLGYAVEWIAKEIDELIVLSGELTPAQSKACRTRFDQLQSWPDVGDMIGRGERLMALDAAQNVSVRGRVGVAANDLPRPLHHSLDPNVYLREVNRLVDVYTNAMRIEDRSARRAELKAIQDAERESSRERWGLRRQIMAVATGDRVGLTNSFMMLLTSMVLPPFHAMQDSEDRTATRIALCRIGWALAEHRAAEGEFPDSLEELASRCPEGIALDLYSGQPLKYSGVEGGFLLYSVGPNGRDDGGRSYGECDGEPDACDDIRFGVDSVAAEMPAEE